ncbi:hypothetical protein SAY86_020748 [Trapa natans]|uniref:Uncharacterized protein n=1 Tax=Trapa natans TaxID=22666 RepID=A0AAN7M8X1_TRANT|nr:hypothetical protein SAY86_020748 [Trapa natans]
MKEWVAKGIYKVAKSHFQEVCNGNYRGQRLERRHVFGAARSAECQRGDSHGIWGSRCQAIWTSSIVPCASVEKTSNIQTVQWLNNCENLLENVAACLLSQTIQDCPTGPKLTLIFFYYTGLLDFEGDH